MRRSNRYKKKINPTGKGNQGTRRETSTVRSQGKGEKRSPILGISGKSRSYWRGKILYGEQWGTRNQETPRQLGKLEVRRKDEEGAGTNEQKE